VAARCITGLARHRYKALQLGVGLNAAAGGTTLTVEVKGVVISQNDLPHIFERYYRRKGSSEGFGLEMPIRWELIERMGSNLSLGSLEGPGTVAEVELPGYR